MSPSSAAPAGRADPSRGAPEVARARERPELPATPFPLHQLVEMQARIRPDHPALEMGDEAWTYAQLDRRANRLARTFRRSGCRPGDRICFLLPKSLDAVATILGILKADCVYVPLDPDSPPPRLAQMVRAVEPRLVVAGETTEALVRGVVRHGDSGASPTLGWLSGRAPSVEGARTAFDRSDVEAASDGPHPTSRGADEPAYVFFTSGSTGTPKGVVITHANVYHFVRWGVGYFDIGPEDHNSGHAPLHFDLSTFDLFGSFAAGATLHLVPRELKLHPAGLARWIRDRALTQWFSVPTALTYMASFRTLRDGDFPTLERVLWCGEVLPTPTLIHWMERVPHATYTNLYGPTEATVASSYFTVPSIPEDPRSEIPIGVPCAGEELLVLDEDLDPVPPGRVGHLYIAGVGLSPGYWHDEEKTRQAFVEDPSGTRRRLYRTGDLARVGWDGLHYFRSREDAQVKIRGYRIELGEVESAAFSVPGIREAAVVAVETGGFAGRELACAYVPLEGEEEDGPTPTEVRTRLAELLPSYMLPSRWRILDRLPKNRNGKVDRPRLSELFREEVG